MMKAIETSYKGHRFRSRLEARTAVLMDGVEMKYLYEPEGFVFEDGSTYLPDFYLPDQDAFLECKGIMGDKDIHKIEQLAKETGKAIVIMYPDLTFTISAWIGNLNELYPFEKNKCGLDESESWICKCKNCGKVYFGTEAYAWDCKCCGYYDGDGGFDVLLRGNEAERYDDCPALIKAKRARFEFGEAGA